MADLTNGMPPVGGANRSIKVVLIGDSNVGKSCLRQRFLSARFTTSYKATIGADFMAKTLPLTPHDADGPKATLIIWDTAGQERFNALGSAFYRGADAVILVVDSSKANAMDNAKKWIETFKERTPVSRCEDVRRFCWICVGTKADLREGANSAALSISSAITQLTDLLGSPASEVKPEPISTSSGPIQGDEFPANPQDVLSRKLPDTVTPAAGSPSSPPARKSFWGSLRSRKGSKETATQNCSRASQLNKRKSFHSLDVYGAANESVLSTPLSRPTNAGRAPGSTRRGRFESTATTASSIYHTPQGSTVLGSSYTTQTPQRNTSEHTAHGANSMDEPSGTQSHRSSTATITPSNRAHYHASDIKPEESEPEEEPTTIVIGDEILPVANPEESSMPPMLSGDPIPFPTLDEFERNRAGLADRQRESSRTTSGAANRVSRAWTLDEVEPEEIQGEEEPSNENEASTENLEELIVKDVAENRPDIQEGFDFILTSSKTGINVDLVFQHVVQRVAARWRYEEWEEDRARREWMSKHPDTSAEEAAAIWHRRKERGDPAFQHTSMSLLQRDREALKRGIKFAAGKDPSPGRACCW